MKYSEEDLEYHFFKYGSYKLFLKNVNLCLANIAFVQKGNSSANYYLSFIQTDKSEVPIFSIL